MSVDGKIDVRPLTGAEEAAWCAHVMSTSEPWITLGRGYDESLRAVTHPDREAYVAHQDGAPGGFLILDLRGALVGYLRTLCVAPEARGRGLGTRLVAFAEQRIFRECPNVFLCVSSFNPGARRLYERLGYERVGELHDFIVAGHSEIVMRKTLGPIVGYVPRPTSA